MVGRFWSDHGRRGGVMVPTAPPGLFFGWPGWRKGRRKGLKIPREKSHVGSIPTPGIGCKVRLGRELGGLSSSSEETHPRSDATLVLRDENRKMITQALSYRPVEGSSLSLVPWKDSHSQLPSPNDSRVPSWNMTVSSSKIVIRSDCAMLRSCWCESINWLYSIPPP